MCGDDLELELEAMSSAAPPAPVVVRKGKKRSGVPGVAAERRHKHKLSVWTGVRFRHSGKWSTEIRVPRTREKVWIGTFPNPRQAALAYDAAVFCLFGERTPKARKINFPAAPRPEISETARLQLTIADMKAISEKHARKVDALLPPLADEETTAASADDLELEPVTPVDAMAVVAQPCACVRRASRPTAVAVVAVVAQPCACARRASRPTDSPALPPDEWVYDDLDRMMNTFDVEEYEDVLGSL